MRELACRACRRQRGHPVFDLGKQPACDYFTKTDAPGPDPVYPLWMWLCSSRGLSSARCAARPARPGPGACRASRPAGRQGHLGIIARIRTTFREIPSAM